MNRIFHQVAQALLRRRMPKLLHLQEHPAEAQERVFAQLMARVAHTRFGRQHRLQAGTRLQEFRAQVPVRAYEEYFPFIDQALKGEADVLWPGKVRWFAKSSGTTNERSKFIPITPESLYHNHFSAGRDAFALYLHLRRQRGEPTNLFSGKALSIGGSHEISRYGHHARVGDLSAVIIENMPWAYELQRTPRKAVALMSEWEAKIDRMARETPRENVTLMAGVPTWTLVLIEKIFEIQRIRSRNLLEVWPNLEVFFHGAVNFEPYRERFRALIPDPGMRYFEHYNASEGYFAMTSDFDDPAMLLHLSNGVFFEFVPLEQAEDPHPAALWAGDVQAGQTYALVISTLGGLWRYRIGDTVRVTQTRPLKIRIEGRIQHFINAFGEELMVANAEAGVAEACRQTGALVTDFTAGPIFFGESGKAGHEWIVEFATPPPNLEVFVQVLDAELRRLNSDYDAKRYRDMALELPRVHMAPPGFFATWLRERGKLGGQNKVPRLANHRQHLEDLLPRLGSR